TYTREWRVTDACGNYTTATQTVNVIDTVKPTFTVPTNIAICKNNANQYDASTEFTGNVTDAQDNCPAESLAVNHIDEVVVGAATEVGTILRLWTVTDACGNIASATQTITLNPAPVASIAVNPSSFCLPVHDSTLVTATLSALPTANYTYNIIRPTTLDTIHNSTATKYISTAGSYIFRGFVTNIETSCKSAVVSDTAVALDYPDFTISNVIDKRGCRDDVDSLNGSFTVSSNPNYTYTISPNVGNHVGYTFSNLPMDTFNVTATHITSSCTYTKAQVIAFNDYYTPIAEFKLGGRDADTAVCWTSGMFLSTVISDKNINHNPTHGYNYSLIVPQNISIEGGNGIRIYAPGTYRVGAAIQNTTTGCSDTAWHYIYANRYPTVTLLNDPFCLNELVTLTSTIGTTTSIPSSYSYRWTSTNSLDTILGLTNSISHLTLTENTYSLDLTANYEYSETTSFGNVLNFNLSCKTTATKIVTPLSLPVFTAIEKTPKKVCNSKDSGTVEITNGWNNQHIWTATQIRTNTQFNITSSIFSVPDSGSYLIQTEDANGCKYSQIVNVGVQYIGFDVKLFIGTDSLLTYNQDLSFCWNSSTDTVFHEVRFKNDPDFQYTYTLITPTNINKVTNVFSLVNQPGTYVLGGFVENTETGCVSDTSYLTVYAVPSPQYTISDDVTICRGDSIKVGISPVSTFSTVWAAGPTENDSLMINPTVYGGNTIFKAYVNVTASLPGTALTCSVNDSVAITINNPPTISKPVVTDV
ncbi:MAG TPA: hypothetical protein PLM70_06160, partial [Bacteroidales bacterium]|nr:hypothetical protein [Bacteroidales bacterium]